MKTTTETPDNYLRRVYGIEPSDLNLIPGQFDIEEVNRLAQKYNLTPKENMSIGKARIILSTVGIKL